MGTKTVISDSVTVVVPTADSEDAQRVLTSLSHTLDWCDDDVDSAYTLEDGDDCDSVTVRMTYQHEAPAVTDRSLTGRLERVQDDVAGPLRLDVTIRGAFEDAAITLLGIDVERSAVTFSTDDAGMIIAELEHHAAVSHDALRRNARAAFGDAP